MSEPPAEPPPQDTPTPAAQPAAAAAVDPAQIAAGIAAMQAQLAAMQAQLAAIQARVEAPRTKPQLAEDAQQLADTHEQAEQVAKQAENAGRPEQAAEARALSARALALLVVIAGATAEALWQAFVQEEIYKPLAVKVRALLERAGQLQLGPPLPPANPPAAPVPTPPPGTPSPGTPTPAAPPSSTQTPTSTRTPARKSSAIEFDWVTIPAGEFLMGSDPRVDKDAADDEQPQHRVYLAAYRIARVPVTNRQFSRFVEATDYHTTAEVNVWELPWYQPRGTALTRAEADHPVVEVSWNDAMAFCRWAGVRLPSEAEWEKAARGTDGRLYPWGNRPPDERLCDLSPYRITPVGAYPAGASPYEVLDMVGNVSEWTRSLWGKDWERPAFRYPYNVRDGRENENASTAYCRVLRGGSWYDYRRYARCAVRFRYVPDFIYDGIGFRVVVSLSDSGF